jgi:hypothetical protein
MEERDCRREEKYHDTSYNNPICPILIVIYIDDIEPEKRYGKYEKYREWKTPPECTEGGTYIHLNKFL